MTMTVEVLYNHILAMCGFVYNGAFSDLENRPLTETLWLFSIWEKSKNTGKKNDGLSNIEDMTFNEFTG